MKKKTYKKIICVNLRKSVSSKGFTLIELLVVIAIIATLIAILSVGLQKVKVVATNLKQKGEFHGMDISIELFQNDFARYPDSATINGGSNYVCGAVRLAEAMEGRDRRGFHPKSKWHPDLEPTAPNDLYNDTTLKERKPVYFELKHSGFYTLGQLWGGGSTGALIENVPVLTDVFVRNQPADTTVDGKVGSPVLYFKADPTRKFRVDKTVGLLNGDTNVYGRWIYNFADNFELLKLAWLRDPAVQPNGLATHYKDPADAAKENVQYFYEILTQRADAATNFYKPYNTDRFVLVSAGWDGIFGTKDDLTNFNY